MTAVAAAAHPLDTVAGLLRARQVSCRGALDDLAQALLAAAQPAPPDPPPRTAATEGELVWRRERVPLLGDRDMLLCALQDLVDAVADHRRTPTRATAGALDIADVDTREALAYAGDPQPGAVDVAA